MTSNKSKTDWDRVDSFTDEELVQNALNDPDNPPITEEEFKGMKRINMRGADFINLQDIYSNGITNEYQFESACRKIERLMSFGEEAIQGNMGAEWDLCDLFNAVIIYENNLYTDWAMQQPYCYCKSRHRQKELNNE